MRVTIPFAFELEDEEQKEDNITREKTTEKIIQSINDNPKVTTAELAEIVDISSKGVEWQLKQLKEKGIIRRVGADKGGHWEIIKL